MPSEQFMKEILESDAAKFARGEISELVEEDDSRPPEEDDEEDAGEQEEQEQPAEDEDDVAEEEGGVPEGDPGDQEGEAEDETEPRDQGEDFYLEVPGARYRTKEEAARGHDEARRALLAESQRRAEIERENAALREQLAYQQGRASSGDDDGFDDWADSWIESDPEGGLNELIQYAANTGDRAPVDGYFDRWVEQDQTGRALARRVRLEADLAMSRMQAPAPQQQAEPEQHPSQPVINEVWEQVANEFPDMRDAEMHRNMAEVIRSEPVIMQAALTGEPTLVREAFLHARKLVRSSQNGPRRVRKSDAEAVAREKRGATVVTGDGGQRRPSSPVMSAEEESLLAGAAKLGLKRRDEE